MKLKKAVTIAAAAGALAAISVPAMAFENEFHGMYKLKYFLSNYETGTSAAIDPTNQVINQVAGTATTARENLKTGNYFEQRARIFYTAKASDDLKLVTAFELDSVFGDKAQASATRGNGGALESDAVNLETKYVYLDFKIPSTPVKVTAGIQPFKDAFKGVFFDGDIAGINTVSKIGGATLGLGYFRAYDQSYFTTTKTRGQDDLHLFALSGDYAINKDIKVGAAYYLYADDRFSTAVTLHTLGANFDAKVGSLGLSGFAAMQQGLSKGAATDNKVSFNGYAFNLGAKLPLGPGNLRTAALWTTGERGNDNVNSAWQSVVTTQNGVVGTATNSYNESNMMLLNRSLTMEGTSTDQSLVYTTNNKDQGVILASLGYDATITPKLYANGNVGFAWASKKNLGESGPGTAEVPVRPFNVKTEKHNGSNFMGTEINLETGYKMYDNLTASFQAAYVFLGGYYTDTVLDKNGKGVDPENPYTARIVLSYAF